LGAATIVDLNDVNFADNSIDANLIKATNTLSEEQNLLYNMSGISQYNIQPIVESIDLHSIVPDNIDYWLKLSQHNNIDIKIAIEQVKMTTADISIAISGHLPTINMNANMQYQDVSNVDNYGGSVSLSQLEYPGGPLSTQSTSSVGVAASLPIFSGGGVHAKTVSAKYTKEATEQQLVTTKRKVEMDVRNSYNKINSMIKMTIAQNKSLQSAKMKLASDKRGYEIGIRTIVDVLNSQNNYYTAWYEYNKSRYELLQARTDLAFLTGQINLDYIKYLNSQITIESTL